MKRPNFFIIGAPKCGTTALTSWLGENPHIYFSPVKEPHFYSDDLKNRQVKTKKQYDQLFKKVNPNHLAVGEASVWYLYSEKAVPNILKDDPCAKFIVCLRNPVDLAFSLHGQQLLNKNESISSFEEAWKAQLRRKEGENIPPLCSDPSFLLYGPACELGRQLERLYHWVDPNRVHVIFLDDIKDNPHGTYQKILKFLGVPDDGRSEFPIVNPASETRFSVLAKTIKLASLARRKLKMPPLGTGILEKLSHVNRKKAIRESMSNGMREELERYFLNDIEKIKKMTGKRP